MVRRITLAILRLLDRTLQEIVPARTNQLAWVSAPSYIGNAFHLYRHMLATRGGHRHVWLVVGDEPVRRIADDLYRWGERGNTVHVVTRHSMRGYWAYLRSRYVFHTHGVYPWVGSAVRRDCVSLWHGMPIKAIGALNTRSPNPNPTFGTLHLATSPTFRAIIARAFRVSADRVLLSSLPRCDVLTEPSPLAPDPIHVRATLDVSNDERLVLWMPTYRASTDLDDPPPGVAGPRTFLDDLPPAQWQRIDEHAARVGARVVIKLHPYDVLNDIDHNPQDVLGLERVQLVRASEWLDVGIELYDLLAVTDALISDVSSVLIDWLLTDRPLAMVGFDPSTYTRDVVIDVERLATSPRVHDLADPADLNDFFDRVRDGRPAQQDPDLNTWLYPRQRTPGCETVLSAIGL